jgi:hypothetical protein
MGTSEETGFINQELIDKCVNLGWIIIVLLLVLFLSDLILAIAIEWDSIK